MKIERREHWETVYETKGPSEVSWTQENPKISLALIRSLNLAKTASIIDVGGGDSLLVDFLLNEGYTNITVLDISAKALEKAKQRLGDKAKQVHWVVSDITEFSPSSTFDLWHDRAAFHFLTTPQDISKYIDIAQKHVTGYMTIGTFSENGPRKCSGLDITQYNEESLSAQLTSGFEKINCTTEDHKTPFDTIQNFLFCSFKRKLKI